MAKKNSSKTVIARSDDGNIQITFTIPWKDIEKTQEEVAKEIGKEIEVPGFRKGMAPVTKVIEHISRQTLLEKTLSKLLPKLVSEAINKHKITPAVYPRFELIKAVEGEDWQIRAVTCELLPINLGDYKKEIIGLTRAKSLWIPGKGTKEEKKPTREEKEQEILKLLLEKIDVKIPKMLIEEETNSRLSKLLERLEKLGLTLESYLSSIGKTPETLRKEYEKQAKEALSLDLILTEIAKEEKISVDPKEIDSAIDAAKADPKLAEELNTPERRQFIEVILKRRKALDMLISLT